MPRSSCLDDRPVEIAWADHIDHVGAVAPTWERVDHVERSLAAGALFDQGATRARLLRRALVRRICLLLDEEWIRGLRLRLRVLRVLRVLQGPRVLRLLRRLP